MVAMSENIPFNPDVRLPLLQMKPCTIDTFPEDLSSSCRNSTATELEEPWKESLLDDHMTDFLREALEERLEHEVATSHLIAEVTALKSRLEDCRLKPFEDTPTRIGVRKSPLAACELKKNLTRQNVLEHNKVNGPVNGNCTGPSPNRTAAAAVCVSGTRNFTCSEKAHLDSSDHFKVEADCTSFKRRQFCDNTLPTSEDDIYVEHKVEGSIPACRFELEKNKNFIPFKESCKWMKSDLLREIPENTSNHEAVQQGAGTVRNGDTCEALLQSKQKSFPLRTDKMANNKLAKNSIFSVKEYQNGVTFRVPRMVEQPLIESAIVPGSVTSNQQTKVDSRSLNSTSEGPQKGSEMRSIIVSEASEACVKVVAPLPSQDGQPKLSPYSKIPCSNKSCQPSTLQRAPLGHCSQSYISNQMSRRRSTRSQRYIGLSEQENNILASLERLDVKLATVYTKKIDNRPRTLASEGKESIISAPAIMRQTCHHKKINGSTIAQLASKSSVFSTNPVVCFALCSFFVQWKLEEYAWLHGFLEIDR